MEKEKLLIIEDDAELRTQMKWGLGKDYQIYQAEGRFSALEILKNEHPLVVTLDLGLPPKPDSTEEGFQTLVDILAHDAMAKVIVITGQHEKENALAAIGRGAYDFLSKPVHLEDLRLIIAGHSMWPGLSGNTVNFRNRLPAMCLKKCWVQAPKC